MNFCTFDKTGAARFKTPRGGETSHLPVLYQEKQAGRTSSLCIFTAHMYVFACQHTPEDISWLCVLLQRWFCGGKVRDEADAACLQRPLAESWLRCRAGKRDKKATPQ